MMYHGKLYGKLWNKYFDTSHHTDDWDAMEKKISELQVKIQNLEVALKSVTEKEFQQRETLKKAQNERNNLKKLVSWIVKNKLSVIIDADIHKDDKEQILRSLGYSVSMLH